MESNDLKLAAAVILGSLLLVGGVVFVASLTGVSDVAEVSKLVGEGRHQKGNDQSGITIVEFSDFQCPACALAFPTVQEFMNVYGDQVSLVYRHFPLVESHPNAMAAAYAAEASSKQNKFWEVHDWLFSNQNIWGTAVVDVDYWISQFGTELTLDVEKFKTDYSSDDVRSAVANDRNEARNLGVSSTPTFFINGKKAVGAISLEDFVEKTGVKTDPLPVPEVIISDTTPSPEVNSETITPLE